MAALTIDDLTTGIPTGTGVFDVLMKVAKEHIQEEYAKGRIKGTEYSQVYLGSMQAILQSALTFVLTKQKSDLEAQLLEAQIALEAKKLLQADAEIALVNAQISKTNAEIQLVNAQITKMQQEADLVAEHILSEQKNRQRIDAEILNLGAQKFQIEAQTALLGSQKGKVDQDILIGAQQLLIATEQVITEQKKHLQQDAEIALIDKQVLTEAAKPAQIAAETSFTTVKSNLTAAEKLLTDQKIINAVTEELVLQGQKCKLNAEFDNLVEQKLLTAANTTKTNSEISLLNQKKVTEQAQVSALGVDADSIIGRQKSLYQRQADGYLRDAEQKAAKMAVDAWIAQHTNANLSSAGTHLDVAGISAMVGKMMQGIGA